MPHRIGAVGEQKPGRLVSGGAVLSLIGYKSNFSQKGKNISRKAAKLAKKAPKNETFVNREVAKDAKV
jgi:hypothetical protein